MGDILNNSTWPTLLSLVIAGVCIVAALRERSLQHEPGRGYLWPTFWWTTAAVLAILAIGQAGDLGELVADAARRDAVSNDWYEGRRWTQAVVVGAIAATWSVTTLLAVWRVPARRRRYLPMALGVFSLICFGAIRIVSLHQIDSLLYVRHIAGVEVGRLIELVVLSAALLMAVHAAVHDPPELRLGGAPVGRHTPATTSPPA